MKWLKQLFARRRRYEDLSVSIHEHLEEKIEELMEAGMSAEEATRTARREFGNVALIEQRGREVWQWPTIESVWGDVKFALRQLGKSPGFTAAAVSHSGAWHWRRCRGLQPVRYGIAPSTSVSRSRQPDAGNRG